MDALLKQLVTNGGFIEAFWTEMRKRNAKGEKATQEEVFDYLNDIFEQEFKEPRFVSFTAFRLMRDKRQKMSQKCSNEH